MLEKRNKEFFFPEKAFEQEKKKRRLKFNPRLVPIGLQTTGPSSVSGPSRSLSSPPLPPYL